MAKYYVNIFTDELIFLFKCNYLLLKVNKIADFASSFRLLF